jgi:hypothetical protein
VDEGVYEVESLDAMSEDIWRWKRRGLLRWSEWFAISRFLTERWRAYMK